MSTPVGHALAGMAAGLLATRGRPLLGPRADLVLFAGLGQAPDLDFIPGILAGNASLYHHGISHSVGAVFLLGLLAALWGWRHARAWDWALMALAVGVSHLLLDMFTLDTSAPYGMPLWWPFSSEYHLWYPLFSDVWRQPPWSAVIRHNLAVVAMEALVLGPLLAASWLGLRRWGRRPGAWS